MTNQRKLLHEFHEFARKRKDGANFEYQRQRREENGGQKREEFFTTDFTEDTDGEESEEVVTRISRICTKKKRRGELQISTQRREKNGGAEERRIFYHGFHGGRGWGRIRGSCYTNFTNLHEKEKTREAGFWVRLIHQKPNGESQQNVSIGR
jgi:hypothetical protein